MSAINARRVVLTPVLAGMLGWFFCLPVGNAADTPREIHGHSDSFAGNGVAIVWGVLRGATEETTAIVLRVAPDPARYARIAIDGVDPFTQRRQVIVAERPIAGLADVRTPRARFADFPRTELRFYATGPSSASAPPVITVFYLGVPDTTPEFAGNAGLAASLTERIARLAAGAAKTP